MVNLYREQQAFPSAAQAALLFYFDGGAEGPPLQFCSAKTFLNPGKAHHSH
jgi:hypothetical protein